jgi:ATP-binding protein involved in chromosome partitioning
MAWFTPEELPDNQYFIFGKGGGRSLAEKYDVPLLGQIPLVQGIRESGDSGLPAVMKGGVMGDAFVDVMKAMARQIAIRNANFTQTQRVEIKIQ